MERTTLKAQRTTYQSSIKRISNGTFNSQFPNELKKTLKNRPQTQKSSIKALSTNSPTPHEQIKKVKTPTRIPVQTHASNAHHSQTSET